MSQGVLQSDLPCVFSPGKIAHSILDVKPRVLQWVEQKSVPGRKTRKVDVEKLGIGKTEKKDYREEVSAYFEFL